MVELPINDTPRKDGKWAKNSVRSLVSDAFPHTDVNRPQLEALVRQFTGWTAVAREYAKLGDMLKAGVLVADPREGVDAFFFYLNFLQSPQLGLPENIAEFDLHGTPLAAPRETSVKEIPAGTTAYSYSLRQSSFNGQNAVTRNIEHYIMLDDFGSTLVFHYQWANPNTDRIQIEGVDKLARMIEVAPA